MNAPGRLTTLALVLGVAGGTAWVIADLLRRAAFTGYGTAGALDYGLTNTLLGGSVILAGLGTAGAVWRIRSSIGLAGTICGWIAVAGCALLAAGSLGEFVFFRGDNTMYSMPWMGCQMCTLGTAAWFGFLIGLAVTSLGLTGIGVRLVTVWAGPRRFVAWWLAASVPLMVAGFLMGLLGSSMAVGVMALCGVLFWGRATESAVGTAADGGASHG